MPKSEFEPRILVSL